MSTPNAMPKKSSTIGEQIVTALIQTKPSVWTQRVIDPESPDPKKPLLFEFKRRGTELVNGLARNVSNLNVERAARRVLN